jgi:hypothetical protein
MGLAVMCARSTLRPTPLNHHDMHAREKSRSVNATMMAAGLRTRKSYIFYEENKGRYEKSVKHIQFIY